MPDPTSLLSEMRRPRLLIRAARHGMQDYRRERDLARLIDPRLIDPRPLPGAAPDAATAMRHLMAAEAEAEATRRTGDARYSIARHIELLIALMAELRLLLPQPSGT